MKYNILIIIIILCFCNTAQAQDDDEILKIPKTTTPAKPTTPAPKPATKPKPTSTTTKPTTPTWKKHFEKQFTILKSNENSYTPQFMIDKYTTLLFMLPSAAKTEKELIYTRIELLKTKIDKDSDGDGFTDKNDNCPNQYATNNNGCPRNGYFTVTYTNGDKYEGSFVNDKKEGKGKYTWSNGNVYEGDWKQNNREGKGKLTWNDGAIYDGDWKEDFITGYGKKTWADGDEYLGNFLGGYRNGYGVYTSKSFSLNNCPECVKYVGNCVSDKKDGFGKCYDKYGNLLYEGQFKDDKPVGTYPDPGAGYITTNKVSNKIETVSSNSTSSTYMESVKIGTQTWSAKNLDVAYFRNGDPIPEVKTSEEWIKAGENKQPAWCYYNNDPANGKKYGKLYNWYAVNDKRGLAPTGWHIPSEKEWNVLIDYLGGESIAGANLKSKEASNWISAGNMNNFKKIENNFNALPAGLVTFKINMYWNFYSLGQSTLFWSVSKYIVRVNNDANKIITEEFRDKLGLSVRCIKD